MSVIGKVGYGSSSSAPNMDFTKNKLILKEELKKQWYVYRSSENTEFRPYPVFTQDGYICPTRVEDEETPYSVLPEAFAVAKIAAFAGIKKDLEFVDFCSDFAQYAPVGCDYIQTPFNFLIKALKKMLPKQGGTPGVGVDGFATPSQLRLLSNCTSYSSDSIIFRCALLKNKGQGVTAKKAVNGTLFNAVLYISQKSAVESFLKLHSQPVDVRKAVSTDNCVLADMFNIDGCSIQIKKSGPGVYLAAAGYDPAYVNNACAAFGITNPQEYYQKVAESFGPYPQVGDILRIMTTAEMVDVLKQNYPISWLWFAWKDTPYAQFLTNDEKNQALADPEMAPRFGSFVSNAEPSAPVVTNTVQVNTNSNVSVNVPPQVAVPKISIKPPVNCEDGYCKVPVSEPDNPAEAVVEPVQMEKAASAATFQASTGNNGEMHDHVQTKGETSLDDRIRAIASKYNKKA